MSLYNTTTTRIHVISYLLHIGGTLKGSFYYKEGNNNISYQSNFTWVLTVLLI